MKKKSVVGLCLVCNKLGYVTNVFRNDTVGFQNINLPVSIYSFFEKADEKSLQNFWSVLQNYTTVFNWTINMNNGVLPENYKFSGYLVGDEVYVSAFKVDNHLLNLQNDVRVLNNNDAGDRNMELLNTFSGTDSFENIDALNELSQLNNELINAQRALIKKNVEITKLNEQLKKSNQELEQLTYVASHDLKEPLRMVTSFMNLLKKNYYHQLDEKAHTYINFAIDGGYRMQTMISDLLDLSRTNSQVEEKSLFNLMDIVDQVLENLHSLIKEYDAEIIFDSTLPQILGHQLDFTRIFQNLIANAVKFRKKEVKPIVHINCTENVNEWIFSIADNGVGIAPENFEKVFNIFTRINPSSDFEGSGIGLAICKKIVGNYGGKIWIESERTNGSVFYFSIKK